MSLKKKQSITDNKILHLISSMDPKSGGVVQAVKNIIDGLQNEGIENEILTFHNADEEIIMDLKYKIHALGNGKTPWNYNNSLLEWGIKNFPKYDIIIVHGLWQYTSYVIQKLLSNRLISSKVFIMPHGMLDPWFQNFAHRKFKVIRNWLIWNLYEKNLIKCSSGLLFTCDMERILAKKTFSNYYPRRESVVGLGVITPPMFKAEMHYALERILKDITTNNYILFLGRVDPKKGVDHLIHAYIKLKKVNPNIPDLVIAGPGLNTPFGKQMLLLAKEEPNIHFTGMLTHNSKWGAFYKCEAFILPSHQENFGIAVVEALACGKPVLISDQVNIWKEIEEQNAGIIEPVTEQGVTNLLTKWIHSSIEEKIRMSEAAKFTFDKYYTIEKAAETFLLGIR